MIKFSWHRRDEGHGVRWVLADQHRNIIGHCFYMPGSKHFLCRASAPVKGGVVLTEYWGGTNAAARKALERDWDKRSIGLFGSDAIKFLVSP